MRHYEFQDPNDRSPNSTTIIAKSTRIRALYNQAHPDDKMENITEKVKTWFSKEAKKHGWDDANFAGNECVLAKKF
jgi:hypothetical protein